jgi:uncharacterized protein YdhG (YjbR/CyaY superfamily)
MIKTKPESIDEYIAGFPESIQKVLQQIRSTILKAAPGAKEQISYGMPAFTLNGKNLVYFACHNKHIGFYPMPSGVREFEEAFRTYETSGKGTIQFPLEKPMPHELIARVVSYRIVETEKRL